ncbi:unnamed protein product [Adineta steineri]|uniref:N-terminal kinase-like protein n=1 Tax=Adineta steineri TaxID=433720 RepID=A0A819PMM9_9BILA|nr:unnamed protein product [Adineta steineri]CAF4019878.1 unnamed protein product [Adineta steineri]
MWGSFFSGGKDPLKDLGYEVLSDSQTTTSNPRSIWTILNGKKKTTGDLVTIFSCQNESHIHLAKAALKRMKTLRHPNVLVYLDGVESDKAVYVVTEKAVSLETYLNELKQNETNFNSENLLEIAWGLQQLCRVLTFLHDDCKLSHGNINTSTVFVDTKSCDWKLACLEFVQSITEEQINVPSRFLPACQRYEPPAGPNKKGGDSQKARDIWFVGTLIWEIFNGSGATSASSYRQLGSIPRPLSAAYGELINSNPSLRCSLDKFCQSPFIQNNSLVESLLFLEQIQLKDPGEKQTFFNSLADKVDQFPSHINERKLLPLLFTAYEFGSSGSAVLPTLFKLGKRLSDNDYKKRIVPIITKLFASTDRMTRFRLLQQLDTYVEHLTPAVVNDDLFTHICTGFTDQEPAIREATVKHFSRLQTSDDQGVIRTNTIVCLGKIAALLNPSLRARLLISAFGRGTQDPFGPSRQASIYALNHSERFFTLKDIATKILPIVCHATIDPELDVRQQAFKTIQVFIKKLETVSEKPELAIEMEKEVNSTNVGGTAANETSWTSWALTSLSSNIGKLTTKPQQPSVNLTLAKSDSGTTLAKNDSQNTLANTSTTPKGHTSHEQSPVKTSVPTKLQTRAEKEEQSRQSTALASYFNKTNDDDVVDDDEEDKTPWDDMKSNDWGDTQDINDDFSKPSAPAPSSSLSFQSTTVKSSSAINAASWSQDKPASQTKNDWDTDAFFNDVLTSSTKPKLKTTRLCGDVRVTLFELRRGLDVHALAACEIILGSVTYAPMHSLTNVNTTTTTPIRFPYLREVYGYILLGYSSLRSFSSMFPRLSIIHGRELYHSYSLIIMDNFLLDELGLTSLINIRRGNIIIARNAHLCYAKSLRWNDIMETKQTQVITRQNRDNCAFCPTCPSACWSPTQCQQRCSSHCKGNCLSETVCCPIECVGGCYYGNITKPSNLICNACRNMRIYATGTCVQQCPQNMLKVNYELFLSLDAKTLSFMPIVKQ